jgi:hypothetical protein
VAGCEACFDGAPAEVWARLGTLEEEARLVGESHFSVTLLRCGKCRQAYLKTFCERIDWQGGNDPQSWVVAPLDEAEVELLRAASGDEAAAERAILALPARLHCLDVYFPSDKPEEMIWRRGPGPLMPHD